MAHPSVYKEFVNWTTSLIQWLKITFPPSKPSPEIKAQASQAGQTWNSIKGQFEKYWEETKKFFKTLPQYSKSTILEVYSFFKRLFTNPTRFKEWWSDTWEIIKNLIIHFRELTQLFMNSSQRKVLFDLFREQNWDSTKKFLEILSGVRTYDSPFSAEDGSLSVFIAEFLRNPKTAVTKFKEFSQLVKDITSSSMGSDGAGALGSFGNLGDRLLGKPGAGHYRITREMIRNYMRAEGELGRIIYEWGTLFDLFVFPPMPGNSPAWWLLFANIGNTIGEQAKSFYHNNIAQKVD